MRLGRLLVLDHGLADALVDLPSRASLAAVSAAASDASSSSTFFSSSFFATSSSLSAAGIVSAFSSTNLVTW